MRDLRREIKQISKHEKETESPDEVVDLVEKTVDFNNQNQEGQGLKILISTQMLSRLTFSLAQLKAGNNSEKLKH